MRLPSLRALLWACIVLAGAAALFFFTGFPAALDATINRPAAPPPPVSERARALHDRLLVVDLHADTLLWSRDLLAPSDRGAVDLPRLVQGNVGIQVFSAVTVFPAGPSLGGSSRGPDLVRLLVMAQRWPARTWGSPLERALHQAARLEEAAARSEERLVVLRSREDLESLLDRRKRDRRLVGALLALEGLYPLEGRLENLDRLRDAGFRMMGLAHFIDSEVAGSAHGLGRGGLTPIGREAVRRMEESGIAIDLAHASPATFDEVLAIATRPVVVSHTGVQATCPGPRNLSDDQLRRVASTGGVVGIAFFEWTVCGLEPRDVARAVRHAADVAGVDHVALGSDWDGAVRTAVDAAGIAAITGALRDAGFSDDEIGRIAGGNAARVLAATLPQR